MFRSRLRRPVHVPNIATDKLQTKDYQFVKGLDTNTSNDDVKPDFWRYITDAREVQVGKWETRRGADRFSVPVGEAVNVEQASTTGADVQDFGTVEQFAAQLVAAADGRLTGIEVNIANPAGASGTVVLALHADADGEPGAELVRTTVAASSVSPAAGYLRADSITCPDIADGTTYWLVGYVQDGGLGHYQITSTTAGVAGLVSADGGVSWTPAGVDFNARLLTSEAKPTKGVIRVKRPTGEFATFMAHDDTLYRVDEVTGATTAVDTDLDPAVNYCRFAFVNDTLYYVDGRKPRKYDFTTASEVTAAPEAAKDIIEHKGLLFFLSAADETKMYYSNFAEYEKFTSTDFIYVPAPKTADPAVGMAKLMGNLYIQTRNNKHVLFGASNATFALQGAVGQKGTFNRESMVYDEQYLYFATDDGIYQFNGSDERNIAEPILDWWNGVRNKDNTVLELHNNRLYVFYTPDGQAINTECKVFNTLYGIWESSDTSTYVSRCYTRLDFDNYFLLASNRVGMLMLAERESNDYNMLGEPLSYELRTPYHHYDAPAQFKLAPIFRPHFDTVDGNWSVSVGYAKDYSDDPNYIEVPLAGGGIRYDTGLLYDDGHLYGGNAAQVNPMDSSLVIAGNFRRLQIRYQHKAAREPVSFDGHVIKIQRERVL